MPPDVVDELDIISATTECCRLGWSPHILMYYIQDPFAHIPLFREWSSVLFSELTGFTYTYYLLFGKCRESDYDPF